MIISVSRRTDIPAFYSKWFFNRLKAGYVLVPNPMNLKQISKISLKKNDVDCFVFWTKNPQQFLDNINELDGYQYYIQISINPYDKSIEVGVPKKKEIMTSFIDLSKKIGRDRVVWRYDPIILSNKMDIAYHVKYFEYIASILSAYTNKCVISFLDIYSKTKRNTKELELKEISEADMITLSEQLVKIAEQHNLKIETCSEKIDLNYLGINHGKCIDDKLISQLLGRHASIDKDSNQRDECGCVKSVDIGMYNTCPHLCKYCYANYSLDTALKNHKLHDPNSPLLFGQLKGDEKITERKIMKHFTTNQLGLFD